VWDAELQDTDEKGHRSTQALKHWRYRFGSDSRCAYSESANCGDVRSFSTAMRFRTPPGDRYFEDYLPGAVHEFGSIIIGEGEIIEFARRFDRLPFHIEPEVAKESDFGGLIASGRHTASPAMGLLVDHYVSPVASLASPGVDELHWRKPVRPGDILSVRVTVLESKLSRSKPCQGTIRSHLELLNRQREVVMTWKGIGLVRCRERSEGAQKYGFNGG
jgi:acyl dehydratase